MAAAVAAFSPHLGWLQKHNFSPMDYADVGSTAAILGRLDALPWADLRYDSSIQSHMYWPPSQSSCWRCGHVQKPSSIWHGLPPRTADWSR